MYDETLTFYMAAKPKMKLPIALLRYEEGNNLGCGAMLQKKWLDQINVGYVASSSATE